MVIGKWHNKGGSHFDIYEGAESVIHQKLMQEPEAYKRLSMDEPLPLKHKFLLEYTDPSNGVHYALVRTLTDNELMADRASDVALYGTKFFTPAATAASSTATQVGMRKIKADNQFTRQLSNGVHYAAQDAINTSIDNKINRRSLKYTTPMREMYGEDNQFRREYMQTEEYANSQASRENAQSPAYYPTQDEHLAHGNLSRSSSSSSLASGEFVQDYENHGYDPLYHGAYLEAVMQNTSVSGGGNTGGCGCAMHPYEFKLATVGGYDESANSAAKDDIINKILEAAANLKLNVSGSTQSEKIKSLIAAIPSADRFKTNEAVHAKTCVGIAKAINVANGNKVIDVDNMTPVQVCSRIAEVLSSLDTGMYSEFLAVYEDIHSVIKNLYVLKDLLEKSNQNLHERVASSDDVALQQNLNITGDVTRTLLAETERQIFLLKNLLNVKIMPSERQLASLLEDKKDLHSFVHQLDAKAGTEEFSKAISEVLRGMGTTAGLALTIQNALKAVGMTINEYNSDGAVTKLRNKVAEKIMTIDDQAEREKFLDYVKILNSNFHLSDEIASKLSRSGAYANGGADDAQYKKTVMDRRISERDQTRKLIFSAFYKQLNSLFDQFKNSLDVVSMKVGTEIPVSEELDGFRHVLQRINEDLIRNKDIYYALIGYYNDANSKSKRDALIGQLKMVSSFIDSIIALPMYRSSAAYFTSMKSHLDAIYNMIEKYSEQITAKFGRGSHCAPGVTGGNAFGSEELPMTGLFAAPTVRYANTKSIHDSIRQFDYKYRVAQISRNLGKTGSELSHYSDKYEKIIANGIADVIQTEQSKYKLLKKQLESGPFGDPSNYTAPGSEMETVEQVKEQRQAAEDFLDAQWAAKRKFWATIEAVDMYMRVFTNALVKNPADIREIKSMLDEIDVISDWYNENTGNNLVSVFECFPSHASCGAIRMKTNAANAELNYSPVEYTQGLGASHYYSLISARATKGGEAPPDVVRAALPGNPFLVTSPVRGKNARDLAKSTLNGLAVLKNLMSVFIHIGSKFGGEEIRKQVFMTPTQMYNNIIEYMQASAFAQGWGVGDLGGEAPVDAFNNSKDASVSFNKNTYKISNSTRADGLSGAEHPDNGRVYGSRTYQLGVSASAHVGDLKTSAHAQTRFRKRFGVHMRGIHAGLQSMEGFGFKFEDEYFVLMLKSIAAKIFTVTGMYDIMDRPMEFNGFNPIRMITGGNSEMPKVEPGAIALYFRLPLLMQFYRGIFGFDSNEGFDNYSEIRLKDKSLKISMVPDVDGVFAGLIRIIFRKAKFVNNDAYSDEDVKEIIRECNLIYQRMRSKYPENTTMETIYELVAEINRRYGIVTKSDRDNYETEFGFDYSYSSNRLDRYDTAPEFETAILPGETDDEIVRPSAAERLLGESFDKLKPTKSMFNITNDHKKLVYKFRCAIDKYFENPDETFTFKQSIKAAELKVGRTTSDEERFKIVAALIRGVDVFSRIDNMKYVMFHETVIAGLNVLSGVHSMLARFKLRASLISLETLQNCTLEYFMSPGSKAIDGLVAHVRDHFVSKAKITHDNAKLKSLLELIFGRYEAFVANGGYLANNSSTPREYMLKDIDGMPKDIARSGGAVIVGDNKKIAYAGSHGLFTVLDGFTADELKRAYKARDGSPAHHAVEVFLRYVFNREHIMKELLELLFGIGHDLQGLVGVKFENGRIFINYGGLKNSIEALFKSVGEHIELLRPQITTELLDKYTNKLIPGSYYWLQEQLIEKIILGRPANATTGMHGYDNIDVLINKLSYTWKELTREYSVSAKAFVTKTKLSIAVDKSHNSFARVLAEMIFYDGSKPSSGLIRSRETTAVDLESSGGVKLVNFAQPNSYESLHFSNVQGKSTIDTRYIARFHQLYSFDDEYTMNRSVLFSFNQLIAKFIQSCYDTTRGKMYNTVIDKFANGTFNRSVTDQLHTYPDTVPGIAINAGTSGTHVSLTTNIMSGFSSEMTEYYSTLKAILAEMSKYGLVSNAGKNATEQNASGRKRLFALEDPLISGNATLTMVNYTAYAQQLGGAGWNAANVDALPTRDSDRVPKLYMWMLVYALAMSINSLLGSTVSPAALRLLQALAGSAGDLDAMKAIFGDTVLSVVGVLTYAADGRPNARMAAINQRLLVAYAHGFDQGGHMVTIVNDRVGLANRVFGDCDGDILDAGYEGTFGSRVPKLFKHLIESGNFWNGGSYAAVKNAVKQIAAGTPAVPVPVMSTLTGTEGNGGTSVTITRINSTVKATVLINAQLAEALRRQAVEYNNDLNAGGAAAVGANMVPNQELGRMLVNAINYYPQITGSLDSESVRAVYAAFVSKLALEFAETRESLVEKAKDKNIVGTGHVSEFMTKANGLQDSVSKLLTIKKVSNPGADQFSTLVDYGQIISLSVDNDNFVASSPLVTAEGAIIAARSENIDGIGGLPIGSTIDRFGVNGGDAASKRLDAMVTFGHRADPDADHVLFTSLSVILKNIITSKDGKGLSERLFEDVADVPLYLKEKMRANLPVFVNLFQELIHRCEFLRSVMNCREVNLDRKYANAPAHNPWPYVLKAPTVSSSDTKRRFEGILDAVINGCGTLISSSEQALKEIGDDPKFFELSFGSIKDYRSMNGVDPFMPLSSSLHAFKNVTSDNCADHLPIHNLGEDAFKFMYGTRLLLQQQKREPSMSTISGFEHIITNYNLSTEGKSTMAPGKCEEYLKSFTKLLRYVYNLKHFKGLLTPYVFNTTGSVFHPNADLVAPDASHATLMHVDGAFTRDDLVVVETMRGCKQIRRNTKSNTQHADGVVCIDNVADISLVCDGHNSAREQLGCKAAPVVAYALAKHLNDVIKLTESTSKQDKIKDFVEHFMSESKSHNSIEIQNIIDLNIIPINVHALMREIPLANLYNYSYTFDRLIVDLHYGLQDKAARAMIQDLCADCDDLKNVTSTKDMLVALLINPYKNVAGTDDQQFKHYVKSMLSGLPDGELGRPKFLSDQVYNKAIFGELYSGGSDVSERGPSHETKISKESLINMIASFAQKFVSQQSTSGSLLAESFNTGTVVSAVGREYFQLCAEYNVNNPNVSMGQFAVEIEGKLLSRTKFAPVKLGTANVTQVAHVTAAIVKIIAKHMFEATRSFNLKNTSDKIFKDCTGHALYTLASLEYTFARQFASGTVMPYDARIAHVIQLRNISANEDAFRTRLVEYAGRLGFTFVAGVGLTTPSGTPAHSGATDGVSDGRNASGFTAGFDGTVAHALEFVLVHMLNTSTESNTNTYTSDLYVNVSRAVLNVAARISGVSFRPEFTVNTSGNTSGALALTNQPAVVFNIAGATYRMSSENAKMHMELVSEVARLGSAVIGGLGTVGVLSANDYYQVADVGNVASDVSGRIAYTLSRLDDDSRVITEPVGGVGQFLEDNGRMRFDTVLMRNIMFVINLYRSVRVKLGRDLVYNRDVIARSASITDSKITEFYGNQIQKKRNDYRQRY